MNPLSISDALKTRTAKAAIGAVAAHTAAALSPKLGFPVESSDVANIIGVLLDLAVIYFRSQAPVRDQQDTITPKP